MQLGSRWPAGSAPHRGVPELLHDAIEAAEAECPAAHSWTLTWLEGRARVELFDARATLLRDIGVTPQGEVVVTHVSTTDAAAEGSLGDTGGVSRGDVLTDAVSEDDDDWLN